MQQFVLYELLFYNYLYADNSAERSYMNNLENTPIITHEKVNKNRFEHERGKTKYIVSVTFLSDKKATLERLLQRCATSLCETEKS